MDVALSHPLSVGVVRWSSPDPQLTVIVKATFSLEGEGDVDLAAEQAPLSLDTASPASPDELAQAGDFAPFKPRADVLLIGSARAPSPRLSHPAAFTVGELRRSFVAMAGAPIREFPLSGAYLRDGIGSGAAVSVGPRSPFAPERRARLGARPLCDHGMPCGPYGADFDFGFFNAAPAEQQLDRLTADVALVMEGLLAGPRRHTVQLPGLRPLVYLVDEGAGRVLTGVVLRCDTLVIDTDAAACTLVWRGPCATALGTARPLLFTAIAPVGTRYEEAEILDLAAVAPRAAAAEPFDLTARTFGVDPTPRPAPVEHRGRATTMVLSAEPDATPPPSSAAPAPGTSRGRATTVALDLSAPLTAGVLPFRADRPSELPPPQPHFDDRPARPSSDGLTALVTIPAAPREGALPFRADHAPDPPPIPQTPQAAPAAPPSIPPPPDDDLSLETYAAVKAALWSGEGRIDEVLSRLGIDEGTFRIREKRIHERLERDAREGRVDRLAKLGEEIRRRAAPARR